jgi:hypothetical protein
MLDLKVFMQSPDVIIVVESLLFYCCSAGKTLLEKRIQSGYAVTGNCGRKGAFAIDAMHRRRGSRSRLKNPVWSPPEA